VLNSQSSAGTIAPQLEFSQMVFVEFANSIVGFLKLFWDFMGRRSKLVISYTIIQLYNYTTIITVMIIKVGDNDW
jgi:hypothetical protein